jgi:hypothetical protein
MPSLRRAKALCLLRRTPIQSFGAWRKMAPRSIEMMRIKQPMLYDVEHIRRNEWWAARIAQLLANGGTYFIAIGLNHTLGRESLLKKLRDIGLEPVHAA